MVIKNYWQLSCKISMLSPRGIWPAEALASVVEVHTRANCTSSLKLPYKLAWNPKRPYRDFQKRAKEGSALVCVWLVSVSRCISAFCSLNRLWTFRIYRRYMEFGGAAP